MVGDVGLPWRWLLGHCSIRFGNSTDLQNEHNQHYDEKKRQPWRLGTSDKFEGVGEQWARSDAGAVTLGIVDEDVDFVVGPSVSG